MRDRDRLEGLLVGGALLLLVGAALAPSWHTSLSGEDFPGHVALLTRFLARLGEPDWLPLWTSDLSSGTSLLLPYLHPIGSLLLLSPFSALLGVELGLRVGDTVFLALAALSMLAWCRSLGASHLAGFVGALVYALHPTVFVFLGRSGQVHQPVTMAVVPLVFLAFRCLAARPDATRLVAAALATAALALDMQRFWLVLPFVLLAYLACPPVPAGGAARLPWLATRVGWAAAAGLGCALLICFPLLPVLLERPELMGHPEELLTGYRQSFGLPHLLMLVDRDGWLEPATHGARAARSGVLAGSAYQGMVPLLLVGSGALLVLCRPAAAGLRASLALLSAGAAASISLAMGTRSLLGQHARIAAELFEARVGVVAWLAFCLVVAGCALALLVMLAGARQAWPARSRSTGVAILGAALLLGSITPFMLLAELPPYTQVRGPAHFAFPLLPFLLGTAASLVLPVVCRAVGGRIPALAFVALLTLLHGIDLAPYRDALRPTRTAAEETAMRDAFRQVADHPRGRALTSEDYAPLGEMLALLEADKPSAWSWLAWSTRGATADVIRLGAFGALAAARDGRGVGTAEFAARAAGLAHVRYIVRAGDDEAIVPDDPAFRKIVDQGEVQIFENLRALAFAQFYPSLALVGGSPQEVDAIMVQAAWSGVATYALGSEARPPPDLHFDYAVGPRARVLASGAAPIESLRTRDAGPAPTHSPCDVSRPGEPEIVLHCSFPQPGHLVVAESWSPQWRAQVDGAPRPLHRLNLAFQGLRVSPEDREIRLRYEMSQPQRLSLAVSIVSWLAVGGFAVSAWRRRERAP